MSDPKSTEPITLVAVERGFAMGRLIEPGTQFKFNPVGVDGKPRDLPKWAAPVGDARLSKPKPQVGDLKPKDAQAAVKQKAGQLAGGGSDLA
jgi:hypothetical protein